MEGYDINKIKFKSKNEPSVEEKLTGKVITGLKDLKEVQPNAELEGKEYMQFPDGTTQLVVGNSHKKDGVKMNIPDGTKIVSHALKLSAKEAKDLKEEYGINVSNKDSYSSAITKYTKKIGLDALYDEEKELYELVNKQSEKSDVKESTRLVNEEYMSGKTREIQLAKEDKEVEKAQFFGVVYDLQEASKSEGKKKKSEDGEMKYGGLSKQNFKAVCKKHGISEEQGRVLMGEEMPSFEEGGSFDELKKKYNTAEKTNLAFEDGLLNQEQYNKIMASLKADGKIGYTTESGADDVLSDESIMLREHQSKSDAGFGKVTKENIEAVMKHYYSNFPEAAKEHLGAKYDKDGNFTWNKDLKLTGYNKEVEAFQRAADATMRASDSTVIDSKLFSREFQDRAKSHLENETFIEEKGNIRDFDGKLGSFTGGRFINKVNVLSPEEKAEFEKRNIYTLSQAEAAIKADPSLASDETKARLEEIRGEMIDGADFRLNTFVQPEKEEVKEKVKEGPIDDTPLNLPKKNFPQLFLGPNEYPTPPAPMDPHLMGESRFQRMDPIRIGIEPQIQEAADQRKFMSEQMFGNLSPEVAASVMANSLASQTGAINTEARTANMTNAQNLANTKLFNIGQAGKESEANLRNKLSFEQRQYTAKANYQEEMKRWEDQIRRININKYKNNSALNLMNQMFPDFDVNAGANNVSFNPQSEWYIKNKENLLAAGIADPFV